MLWVDKYRPKTLDKMIVHADVAQNLKKLFSYLILKFLIQSLTWFAFINSPANWIYFICLFGINASYVVEHKGILHSLRRTMEKYSASCRLILCGNSSSKVTEAVRSRCLNVRINAPTEEQEGLQIPPGFTGRIAAQSNRSLRRAILLFETCRVQQYPFTSNQAIPSMDWEQYITEIASDILQEQSPKRLFVVRGKLYELLINCIPPVLILKRLLFELLKKLDAELKHEVCYWAAYYEHRMRLGQKAIFHMEAFVAKFVSIYKAFLISTFG
ncbi:hypothetical protein MKW98_032603 [Papaver atlanticum]|uniref:Replication factor C subunit 3 n=1 Tax=Papaver atlanticum TaxID=357466 RepID=A0AAD4XMI2_9MAGN|nr:hypothetical protein MKW98_032603 [Papaver atlanticum]